LSVLESDISGLKRVRPTAVLVLWSEQKQVSKVLGWSVFEALKVILAVAR
jgi:hypothetical protein